MLVDPRIALISVEWPNPFRHPSAAVVRRLQEHASTPAICTTAKNGRVLLSTDEKQLWVRAEL